MEMEESTNERTGDMRDGADGADKEISFGFIKKTVEDKIDTFINKKFKDVAYDAKQA